MGTISSSLAQEQAQCVDDACMSDVSLLQTQVTHKIDLVPDSHTAQVLKEIRSQYGELTHDMTTEQRATLGMKHLELMAQRVSFGTERSSTPPPDYDPLAQTIPGAENYAMVHPAADCCRTVGEVGRVDQRRAKIPRDCVAACNELSDCKYFSHSTEYEFCELCNACDYESGGPAGTYTSWKRNFNVTVNPAACQTCETEIRSILGLFSRDVACFINSLNFGMLPGTRIRFPRPCDICKLEKVICDAGEITEGKHIDGEGLRSETVVTRFGRVIINGDSSCDPLGPSQGRIGSALTLKLENTRVENHCLAGTTVKLLFDNQVTCRKFDECIWAVVQAGMEGNGGVIMADYIAREKAAGKKVIIAGYPDPDPRGQNIISTVGVDRTRDSWNTLMDSYKKIAEGEPDVYFIDPRDNLAEWGWNGTAYDMTFYHSDQSLPSPKSSELMGNKIGDLIIGLTT